MNNDIIASIRAAMPVTQVHLADKMGMVRAEYIATDLDDRLSKSLNALLRTLISRQPIDDEEAQGARNETRSLVVAGEAGTGKTAALNHAFRTHPVLGGYGRLGSGCPIARVVVPAPSTLKALGVAILNALGYPLMRELRENAVWTRVHEALQISGTVILHLDEMHNATDKANVPELDAIRKALKGLMVSRDWPVGLVVSGLPSLVPAMRAIDEVRRRGRFISIPLLSMPDDVPLLGEALKRCCETAGIELPDGLSDEIGPRLSHASLHRYGIAVEIVHEAIEDCLLADGGALRVGHFANAYAARTGCGDRMNPFIAPDWAEIDASQVLLDEMPPEIVVPDDPKPKKRGRPSKKGS